MPFALCFYPHFRGATRFGGSVHLMRSVFSGYQGAAIFLQRVALILTRIHHACATGRVGFSAEPSVRGMRYGSITLKSAVAVFPLG
jgi:hypothetical protein